MLQLVAQVIFQRAAEHVLVKRRVKGQHRAVADVLHEVEQRLAGSLPAAMALGPNAVDQHAGAEFELADIAGCVRTAG